MLQQPVDQFFAADGNVSMREFKKHDAESVDLAEERQALFFNQCENFRIDMDFGGEPQFKGNLAGRKRGLKRFEYRAYRCLIVIVTSGVNVWRYDSATDAMRHSEARQCQRLIKSFRAIVDPR